jgi:hypothetical protein
VSRDKSSDNDRLWFERHPTRRFRLRRPFRDEEAAGDGERVLVWQGHRVVVQQNVRIVSTRLASGYRICVVVAGHGPLENTEENAGSVFNAALPRLELRDAEFRRFTDPLNCNKCRGCGRGYQDGEGILAGIDGGGEPTNVGLCCIGKLRALVCSGTFRYLETQGSA